MHVVKAINDLTSFDINKINNFLSYISHNNVFHSISHYYAAKDCPTTNPTYFLLYDNNRIKALQLLVTHNSAGLFKNMTRRAVIYGPPVIDSKNSNDLSVKIISSTINYINNNRLLFTQFRYNKSSEIFDLYNDSFVHKNYLNLIIENRGASKIWKALSRSKKWQIRKSIKTGATLKEAQSEEEIMQWYTILHRLYKTKILKPLPPLDFFISLYQQFKKYSSGLFLLVMYNKKVIGGILLPQSSNEVLHEWYICGQDKTYKEKNIYPSVLATWGGIDYMIQNNINSFDFMGLGNPDREYGVRDFKMRFGGEVIQTMRYTYYPNDKKSKILRKFL